MKPVLGDWPISRYHLLHKPPAMKWDNLLQHFMYWYFIPKRRVTLYDRIT